MRIINRPMSTTYASEFLFHLIRDKKEAENIKKVAGDKNLLQVMRSVNPDTFQPMLFFAIEEKNKPFSEWLKYVAPMELMLDETKEDNKRTVSEQEVHADQAGLSMGLI